MFSLYSPRRSDTLSKVFFPRSVTKENGYHPRVASNATAIQTEDDGLLSPDLVRASTHMQIHSHLTSVPGSPKSVSREGTPSPTPAYLRHTYSRSGSDIPMESDRPPPSLRRRTLPESVLHHFVRCAPRFGWSLRPLLTLVCRLRHLRHQLVSDMFREIFSINR